MVAGVKPVRFEGVRLTAWLLNRTLRCFQLLGVSARDGHGILLLSPEGARRQPDGWRDELCRVAVNGRDGSHTMVNVGGMPYPPGWEPLEHEHLAGLPKGATGRHAMLVSLVHPRCSAIEFNGESA